MLAHGVNESEQAQVEQLSISGLFARSQKNAVAYSFIGRIACLLLERRSSSATYAERHAGPVALSSGASSAMSLNEALSPYIGFSKDLYGRLCARGQVVPMSVFSKPVQSQAFQPAVSDLGFGVTAVEELQEKVRHGFYL